MKKLHKVERIVFDKDNLFLRVDGKEYKFRLADISGRLAGAPAEKREKFEISPSGYGIHWPLLDEDLSIKGLLNMGRKSSLRKFARPMKNWRASSSGSARQRTRTKHTPKVSI
jgi:hypothetical protein